VVLLIALIAITSQCKNELDVRPETQGYLSPNNLKDQLSVKMAKILAQRLTDQTRERLC